MPEKAKNFGLPLYFKVQRFCFNRIGIEPTDEKRFVHNYFWNITPTLSTFLLIIAMLHYSGKNIQDVDEVTHALSPFWQCVLTLCKWGVIMMKRRKVVGLINRFMKWSEEANEAERLLLVKENQKDIFFSNIYHKMVASTGVLVIANSFIMGFTNLIRNEKYQLVVPIKASYPMDVSQNFSCFIGIVWVTVSVYFVIYGSVSCDALFSWITFNLIGQFRILRYRFRQAAMENDGKSNRKSIINCIQYHWGIIDMINEFNEVIGVVIFFKFIISTMQVCVLTFQLSRVGNVADMMWHTGFLLSVATQLILYCRNAQQISDESLNVCWSIYESFQWEKVPISLRKLLLMPMARARRVCNLSGVFFVANMGLYLWVFRTASSYIAVLVTLEDK